MNTKIKVKSHTKTNGWFNIKTEDGKEVSVMAEKNPKLSAILEANPDGGCELYCSLVEKNGKNYAWDAKESSGFGGGFKSKSGNEGFALAYSKDIYVAKIAKGEQASSDAIIGLAEKFYEWLESKKK